VNFCRKEDLSTFAMTMNDDEVFGRIKMGVNVDIKRSDGKLIAILNAFSTAT
jgi:hypothetical protein